MRICDRSSSAFLAAEHGDEQADGEVDHRAAKVVAGILPQFALLCNGLGGEYERQPHRLPDDDERWPADSCVGSSKVLEGIPELCFGCKELCMMSLR